MTSRTKFGIALVAAFALGGAMVEGIHAQSKSKAVYVIAEIEVTNLDAYVKDYAPKAQALIKKSGGTVLAAGQNVTALEGTPPAKRVALQRWESMDQLKAYRNSAEFKEVRKTGDKYAKFRAFAVEAMQ
jgi:uncharacterized protein (DUF1330 family)